MLFPVNGARSTPRPQSRRVATLCTDAAFALYNDTTAARMATLTRRKIVSWGHRVAPGNFPPFFPLFSFLISSCINFFFYIHVSSEKPFSNNFFVYDTARYYFYTEKISLLLLVVL